MVQDMLFGYQVNATRLNSTTLFNVVASCSWWIGGGSSLPKEFDQYWNSEYACAFSKKTDKIFDDQKKKCLPSIEKALELCKENKMEEARIIMDELRDQFFQDALTNESQFFSH